MPLLDAAFLKKLNALSLRSRKRGGGTRGGERRSNQRGQSQEFADHRGYVPGDDLRFLDWHLYARLDTLWIKLFEEETDRTVQIIVDCSASMEGEKLEYSRKVAAALSWIALGNSDRVSVGALSDAMKSWAPPRRGRRNAHGIFNSLEIIHPDGETDVERALIAWPRHRGAGIVLLFTDFLYPQGHDRALRKLCSRGDEVHAFHVMAPNELKPPLSGDLTLIDRETGETMNVTVNDQVLERYTQSVLRWSGEVEQSCRRLGVTYNRLMTHVPVEDLIMQDLRRGRVLA
ncbi:MAG: hypothetical protein ACI9MC_003845 [Kiritimatiellia bacterium]|jgi:uncharacterized protein (DUF58 family)